MKPDFFIIDPHNLPGLLQEIKSSVRAVTKAHENYLAGLRGPAAMLTGKDIVLLVNEIP